MRLSAPALLLLVLAAGVSAQDDAAGRPILVTGQVVEREGGSPIPAARVALDGAGLETRSDIQGLFEFLRVPPGTYLLRVEHLGYGAVEDSLEVPDEGRLVLEIQLVARPFELDPVVVAVSHRVHPATRGFYERRRTGMGRYLTRADFDRGAVLQVTDALRRIPGIRLMPRTVGGVTIGQAVLFRGGCTPVVYLDGTRLTTRGTSLDEILHPDEIEGVEVYRGPETPAEFALGSGGCGAIVIWTRPGGGEGDLPLWKAALITGGVVLLAILFGAL